MKTITTYIIALFLGLSFNIDKLSAQRSSEIKFKLLNKSNSISKDLVQVSAFINNQNRAMVFILY